MPPEIWRIRFRDNSSNLTYTKYYDSEKKYKLWLELIQDKEYWDCELLSHGPVNQEPRP